MTAKELVAENGRLKRLLAKAKTSETFWRQAASIYKFEFKALQKRTEKKP